MEGEPQPAGADHCGNLYRIIKAALAEEAYDDVESLLEALRGKLLDQVMPDDHNLAAGFQQFMVYNLKDFFEELHPNIYQGLNKQQRDALFQPIKSALNPGKDIQTVVKSISTGAIMGLGLHFAQKKVYDGPHNLRLWAREMRFAVAITLVMIIAAWGTVQNQYEDQEGYGVLKELKEFWEDGTAEFNKVLATVHDRHNLFIPPLPLLEV